MYRVTPRLSCNSRILWFMWYFFYWSIILERRVVSASGYKQRIVGYYEGWSSSRSCDGMWPETIPLGTYTHLNYAYAVIHSETYAIIPMSSNDISLYPRFTNLKSSHPDLRTWISISAPSVKDAQQQTPSALSTLVKSASGQDKFVLSLLSFMSTYGFDGVDLDWAYAIDASSGFSDYVSLLAKLRTTIVSSGYNYGISITIPSEKEQLQSFDIASLSPFVDFFNLKSFDLQGTWDTGDPATEPTIRAHSNLSDIGQIMEPLKEKNVDLKLVNFGLGIYGRSFTLADPDCAKAGCSFVAGGNAGTCTSTSGLLSYGEVQRLIAAGYNLTSDDSAAVKILSGDSNQWVSYDDAETLSQKIEYASDQGLGGIMVWAISMDDANGTVSKSLSGSSGPQKRAVDAVSKATDTITECQWGECSQQCPQGYSAAARGDQGGTGVAAIYNACPNAADGSRTYRPYCCPSNDVPTCQWRGTAPFCSPKCQDDEVEVTSDISADGHSCITGHKILCCKSTVSDEAIGQCKWYGASPVCNIISWESYGCPDNTVELTYDKYGAGGESPCALGYKSLCCSTPVPYTGCDWYYHGGSIGVPFVCGGGCPAGKHPIASDSYGCISGTGFFCCDTPQPTSDPAESTAQNLLNLFKVDPTCSKGERAFSKRDLPDLKAVDHTLNSSNQVLLEVLLQRRQSGTLLTTSQESTLVSLLTAAFLALRYGGGTSEQAQIRDDFDATLGNTLHVQSTDFLTQYDLFPETDPNYLTESLMCQGPNAGDFLDTAQDIQANSCRTKCDCSCRVSASKARKEKRTIAQGWDEVIVGPEEEPNVPTMLYGVIGNHFEYLYTRLIRYHPGQADEDLIVEIAWRIGDHLANEPDPLNDPDSYRYLGPDLNINPPDNYFVVHLHTNHLLTDEEATPYAGINAIQAFHGQRINQQTLRVVGNDMLNTGGAGRNERVPVLRCGNNFVYAGYDVDSNRLVEEFLSAIQRRGYLSDAIFSNVALIGPDPECLVPLEGDRLENGESNSLLPDGNAWTNPNNYQ